MYYVLEYCDTTLDKQREQLSLRQLKSIAFQLIYALHVAQGENEFAHLDLHMKNVLLQTLDASDAIEYDVGGRVHRCDSFMVKIADFGLSRITLDDGRVIFNDRQQMGDFFDTCKRTDIEQIEAHLARIGKRAFDNDTASVLAGATSSGGGGGATDDLTIDWQNLTRLRSRIRSGDPLAVLLDDDFFDSLRLPFVKSAAVPPAAPASSSSARKSVGRKSIGAKTTTVDVLLPAQQVPQRRFSYRPRAAMPVTPAATAAALQPHTTQRRRTRSAVKEERAVATEKTANALRRSREADENADNENAAELETVRKRLSFAP
jgi:serine/threonine protein kinase